MNITDKNEAMPEYKLEEIRSRLGWKKEEDDVLWEQVSLARKEGRALKSVFDAVARLTGRKPNSIRNYYYARMKEEGREFAAARNPAFVPFKKNEIWNLIETVLGEQARGVSVRACTLNMGNGDNKAMLRYQNKYRSVLKTNPELVKQVMEQMKATGEPCFDPYAKASKVQKKPGRPRKNSTDSLVETLGNAIEQLRGVQNMDVTGFFEGIASLAACAARGASFIAEDGAEPGEENLSAMAARQKEENSELRETLAAQYQQSAAQKDRFNKLLGLFRQLMNVNREFLGLTSVIKVSNLSSYIKELSRSVEDCEKLLVDYM